MGFAGIRLRLGKRSLQVLYLFFGIIQLALQAPQSSPYFFDLGSDQIAHLLGISDPQGAEAARAAGADLVLDADLLAEIEALFALPFNDLLFRAQTVHRAHFDPNEIQVSTLLSIKTGACAEDCAYCSQSARYDTGLQRERLLPLDEVREQLRQRRSGRASQTRIHLVEEEGQAARWTSSSQHRSDGEVDPR